MSNRPISDLDRRILARLKADGRATATSIGKDIGLSRSAVHQRIQRMERDRVILGYTTITERPAGDELVVAIVLINLVTHRYSEVASTLSGWPEVRSCWSIAGDRDLAVLAEVASNSDLMDLTRRLSDLDAVRDTSTHIALMTHFDR